MHGCVSMCERLEPRRAEPGSSSRDDFTAGQLHFDVQLQLQCSVVSSVKGWAQVHALLKRAARAGHADAHCAIGGMYDLANMSGIQ